MPRPWRDCAVTVVASYFTPLGFTNVVAVFATEPEHPPGSRCRQDGSQGRLAFHREEKRQRLARIRHTNGRHVRTVIRPRVR